MRIDPKYFNRFIAICALITIIVIIYSTIRYSQRQVSDFQNNTAEIKTDTLSFRSFSVSDSLHFEEIEEKPVIIHFWSTWSGKSMEVADFLEKYHEEYNGIFIIAAAVRDSDEKVEEFIAQNDRSFHYVDGTGLFQTILTPGVPSQIFFDSQHEVFDTHVGNDTTEIRNILNQLMESE